MKTILTTITRVLKRQRGFTLVEMVTVVAIMGVMAAVAVPMASNQIGKARDKSYAQDLAMIQTAVDSFFTDSDNSRFQGQRQYPILGANSGVDNSATGGEDRSAEAVNEWLVTDTGTDLATPLNPKRGTQGGEPKWMDGPLSSPDSNRSSEDNLNSETESINRTGVGWYITKVTHQGSDFAVDTRDYLIDFRKLVALGLLQSSPESASLDNGGGSATGEVESLFFHFPTKGTDIDGTFPEAADPDNDATTTHLTSSDLRGFVDGVYP